MNRWLPVSLILLSTCALFSQQKKTKPAVLAPLPAEVPAPKDNPTTPAKVELGRQLFFDVRLSGNNRISCASCHEPGRAFTDGRPLSPGADGMPLRRNTRSCLNAGFAKSLLADGRAASLEEQALLPIQSPAEMNQPLGSLEKELAEIPGYVRQFKAVFGEKPNRQDLARALAAFQRTLVSGPSPFDRFLSGEKEALSADARAGYELFRGEAGCIACHNGPLLSDGKFYRLGISFRDEGRARVTGKKEDRYRFTSRQAVGDQHIDPGYDWSLSIRPHKDAARLLVEYSSIKSYLRGCSTSPQRNRLGILPGLLDNCQDRIECFVIPFRAGIVLYFRLSPWSQLQ